MDLQIIRGDTNDLLEHISNRSIKAPQNKYKNTNKFPEMEIPNPISVPAISVLEFYKGAPPQWYNIFHSKIFKTKFCGKIRNLLSNGKSTVILGIPACGKTTLLMQTIAEHNFDGNKLICQSITVEKATLLSSEFKENSKLLLAIDNFSDSIDSIEVLAKNKNIQLLLSDRSYNFDTISHKIETRKFNIIDVSELEDQDIQDLLDSIPNELKTNNLKSAQKNTGNRTTENSIFEIIENSLWKISLKERYKGVIKELERINKNLAEFFIVSSYVHRCRTPISMDMLLAYFRNDITNYNDIYDLASQLGHTIKEYFDALDDGQQDYFSPRSSIVSESVLDQANQSLLKDVIVKFHEQVSPLRIHRHDIFKTKAFGADLMRKAFDNWEEGLEFYTNAHLRDKSPYLLQQAALYLMHKRRYTESFSLIDQALIESQQKITSIKNSHAIILFRANIDKEETESVVSSLNKSMEILTECYHADRRKSYHATTMADHALQYDSRFGREKSEGYLRTAQTWLSQELKKESWNRSLIHLSKVIQNRLNS